VVCLETALAMTSPHCEASRLLEAALQQMDGIIQGAKFEIPNYEDRREEEESEASRALADAVRNLKVAIVDADQKDLARLKANLDADTAGFLGRWLTTNQQPASSAHEASRAAAADAQVEVMRGQLEAVQEERDRQGRRLADLEQLLAAKKELLRKTEQALDRERNARASMEARLSAPTSPAEASHLRAKMAELEAENRELRRLVGGERTPRYLPLSSPSPVLAGDSSPEGDQPFPGEETDNSATSPRSARGFKKIFGKVRRSNSGGQAMEDSNGNPRSVGRPQTPEFRRGGFRATAGPRLAHNQHQMQTSQHLANHHHHHHVDQHHNANIGER